MKMSAILKKKKKTINLAQPFEKIKIYVNKIYK